jgi:hypothetical protein
MLRIVSGGHRLPDTAVWSTQVMATDSLLVPYLSLVGISLRMEATGTRTGVL